MFEWRVDGEAVLIEVFVKKVEDVWFGVTCDTANERVYATNFGSAEEHVLQGLIKSIPRMCSIKSWKKLFLQSVYLHF